VEVIGEEVDPSRLPSAVEKNGAQWLVVSLPRDGKLPGFLRTLLDGHPTLCLLAVAGDASCAKIWCSSTGERVLDSVSLDDLLNVMHQTSRQPDKRSGKPERASERSINNGKSQDG
jgi:hypothetical protein